MTRETVRTFVFRRLDEVRIDTIRGAEHVLRALHGLHREVQKEFPYDERHTGWDLFLKMTREWRAR